MDDWRVDLAVTGSQKGLMLPAGLGILAVSAKAIEAAPPGEWRALATKDGWRAMRLEAVIPAKPAQFEVMRGVAMQDWNDATMTELRTAQVRTLAGKYKITFEAGQP